VNAGKVEMMERHEIAIEEDKVLLEKMIDAQKKAPLIYQPGPYWIEKTAVSLKELSIQGIRNFRSMDNNATQSYGDALLLDSTAQYDGAKGFLAGITKKFFPFNKFLLAQTRLTKWYIQELIKAESYALNSSERALYLVEKYKISEGQLLGEVDRKSLVHGEMRSHHFIYMLDLLDRMIEKIAIADGSTYMEIGGGFGANVFLMAQNFPQIRKYIYIDIAPNLYVGTQFLKANFGKAVKNFSAFESQSAISFSDDTELEIICLLPNQIQYISSEIDIFHNANSFVEMPKEVVQNYALEVKKMMSENGVVLFSSYGNFDKSSTFDPDELCEFFDYRFEKYREKLILVSEEQRFYVGKK
jgi:putative sugar O-methyltransferase